MTNVEPNERYLWAGSTASPIYFMDKNIRRDEMLRLIGNAFVRIKPMDGLQLELSGSANYYDLDGSTYTFPVQEVTGQQVRVPTRQVDTILNVNGVLWYKHWLITIAHLVSTVLMPC